MPAIVPDDQHLLQDVTFRTMPGSAKLSIVLSCFIGIVWPVAAILAGGYHVDLAFDPTGTLIAVSLLVLAAAIIDTALIVMSVVRAIVQKRVYLLQYLAFVAAVGVVVAVVLAIMAGASQLPSCGCAPPGGI